LAHDVFISYSDSDREIAEALAETLKVEGVSATLGPAASARGKAREEAVDEEIDASGALLLVFSWNALGSRRLLREVERAVDGGTPVVSFHADKTPFDPELEYYVAPAHRVAASGASAERSTNRVVEMVKRLIPGGEAAEGKGSTGFDTGVYGRPDTGELSKFKRRLRREGDEPLVDVLPPVQALGRRRWPRAVAIMLGALFVLYVLGAQFGYYAVGVMAACVGAAYLLVGLVPDRRRSPMFTAIVLTFGHLLWFASGLLILALAGGVEALMSNPLGLPLDAAIFSVFFVWLIVRPGVVSGVANIALSLFFMYGGLASVSGDWATQDLVSGVVLHAILYVATIIALLYGIVKMWGRRRI